MAFFSNNIILYMAVALSIINGAFMCFASYKFFQIIQLSGYKLRGYFVWLKETKGSYAMRMVMLSLLSIFCVLVTNALFDAYHSQELYSYIGLIFYFYFTIVFIVNLYSAPKKVPLKNTTRMTRLNIAMFIFVSIFSFLIIALSTEYLPFLKFGALCFVPLFMPFFVPFVHIVMLPIEKFIATKYVLRAKSKLKKFSNEFIKIGITGSFGKTSTKYILNSMLSQKYKVCMSPHSFNTLPGLCKVVNDYLTLDNQVLIAEMGAKNKGDIKELCNLIEPKYAIITGVGNQHLSTFKTQENILNTKFELVESLKDKGGFVVFNGYDMGAKTLYDRCDFVSKFLTGENDSLVKVENFSFDENGTDISISINGEQYNVHTKLIGSHNVQNIVMCAEMACRLGLNGNEIIKGIEQLQPIPHRLEVIKTKDNVILDDSFNASVEGYKVALEVLSKMKGKKIVVTPGLVELGGKEYEENKKFGLALSKVADKVIVVNNVNFNAIKEGLDEGNFEDIYQAPTLDGAKKMLQDFLEPNDTILFENDLPDNYI